MNAINKRSDVTTSTKSLCADVVSFSLKDDCFTKLTSQTCCKSFHKQNCITSALLRKRSFSNVTSNAVKDISDLLLQTC